MKNIFRNNTKKTIALILLGFFVFSFLHSELGFLDFDGDNHGTHDYCQIVKNTNAHSKILREELPKLELNKDLCFHCFEEIEAQTTQTYFGTTDHHLKAKTFADLYLFNSSFLI
ncbi:MAG: hypothetical protein NTX65_04035 [Ignavibacteriales bacterium]|nr:hypothetical protein [Ignavibacteriales bacterium]